jgi:hypothetical protein
MKLFHATFRKHLDSIQKYGLNGLGEKNFNDSVEGVTYLATSYDVALSYAECTEIEEEWTEDIVVFSVNISDLNPDLLKSDTNVIDNDGSTLEYHGFISFHLLTLVD